MEKMTVSYCSQVPASRVLVLLAALQGTAATINDPNEAAVRGTEPVLAYVESPLRCVSNRSYNGLYMLIKSLVLLWLKWQKGAIVFCPPLLCPVPPLCPSVEVTDLGLDFSICFWSLMGTQRACSFSTLGLFYGLGRVMLKWLFLGCLAFSVLCGLRFGPGVGRCTPCFPAQSHPINSRGRWDARGQLCLFDDFRRTIKLSRWLLVVVLFGFVILSGGERE